MTICSKCGSQLQDGAKFCPGCGAQSSGSPENSQSYQPGYSKRETVFEGEIHKCPSCGEVLGAFVTVCPSCGYEIRGGKASSSLHEFSMSLANATSDEQRVYLFRNFPVPNTKEDIFEFLILASSNLTGNTEQNICDAWTVKFKQVEQKAKLALTADTDKAKFNELYEQVKKKLNRDKYVKTAKKAGGFIVKMSSSLPQIIITLVWSISIAVLVTICCQNVDSAGFSPMQLVTMLDLILGATVVPSITRCDSVIPKLIATIGLLSCFGLLIPRCSDSDNVAYMMIMIVAVICGIIMLTRMFKAKKK